MDPLHPVGRKVAFGPIDGEALRAELNREKAAAAFRCVAAQIVVVLACCLVAAIFAMTTFHKLAIYDAQLAACAGGEKRPAASRVGDNVLSTAATNARSHGGGQ